MNTRGMVRAWLETLIEASTGSDKATPDEDGAYSVDVRVSDKEFLPVRLFVDEDANVVAVAEAGRAIERTPELLTHVNEFNTRTGSVTLVHVNGSAWIQGRHRGMTLDEPEYHFLVGTVARASSAAYATLSEHLDVASPLHPIPQDSPEGE